MSPWGIAYGLYLVDSSFIEISIPPPVLFAFFAIVQITGLFGGFIAIFYARLERFGCLIQLLIGLILLFGAVSFLISCAAFIGAIGVSNFRMN